MKLIEVDRAIAACRAHLKATGAYATEIEEIETIMVRYLLALIYGQYEQAVKRLLRDRARLTEDPEVSAYIRNSADRVYRGLQLRDLGDVLALYGDDVKRQFGDAVGQGTAMQTAWDSIRLNRHDFAHASKTNALTLGDIEFYYRQSNLVLDKFAAALGVQ